MMQLVRDEHAMILDFLKAQTAAEKSRLAADDDADAQAQACGGRPKRRGRRRAACGAASPPRRAAVRRRAVAARHRRGGGPSLRIACAARDCAQSRMQAPPPAPRRPARDPNSLLAKTLAIKDHVVAATLQVVSAIGSIPSWIASMGDRIGAAPTRIPSAAQLRAS